MTTNLAFLRAFLKVKKLAHLGHPLNGISKFNADGLLEEN